MIEPEIDVERNLRGIEEARQALRAARDRTPAAAPTSSLKSGHTPYLAEVSDVAVQGDLL
jgi:hypothetical protein